MDEVGYPEIEKAIPHRGRMIFLAGIVDHTKDSTTCVVEVGEDSLFREPGGLVPAWVGLEYMAQCVAAHGGLRARATGQPVKVGFFVGSRRIDVHTGGFSPGQVIEVRAKHLLGERGFFSFACSLRDRKSGALLMEGNLNVFLSEDLEASVPNPS